jgi:ferric-dicitrate binding protein FerR (iron transport regulator)
VDCEQASLLISAQLDHEIQPQDSVRLAEHLQECEACRSAVDAFRSQDADLRRAFGGCERSAARVAERVIAQLTIKPREETPMYAKIRKLWNNSRRHIGWFLPAAAMVAGVAIILSQLLHKSPTKDKGTVGPLVRETSVTDLDFMTPRPRPQAEAVALKVGESVRTEAGQRKRLTLADGSILYVNEKTTVKLTGDRRLTLDKGEVFVEVAPTGLTASKSPTFLVETPNRAVSALGTKFAVKAADNGTGVVVTQGKVKVTGLTPLVLAGQQLEPGASKIVSAQRSTHVLDWTRDLMAAAESPLVPKSEHCGGALIALDPFGQEARLSLRKYHIDVHIEDGFARTTIDQTYFNHNAWRLEGTFHFPLPPDASLSRLAMYVANGNESNLMEGGMAERDYARNVFEQIMYTQRDPALLEWVDGSTFKMRVFPLEGRQEKRIILSYTQKLDSLYGYSSYRFPSGHSMQVVGDWSFHARIKNGASMPWSSASHELKAKTESNDLVLDAHAKSTKPDKDVTLRLADGATGNDVRFSKANHDGAQYLMLRYRPQLVTQAEKQRRDWVFLFEASGDRDPIVARAQIDVIKTLLENAEHDDTFSVLTANTRVFGFDKDKSGTTVFKATPENIDAAVKWLEKSHLIGALDLGQALSVAKGMVQKAKNPILVHVGSGVATIGERKEDVLAKSLPDEVPYVGVGVGKRWSRNFMKAAAERSGGAFLQINPDESISWRAFELSSLLNTPRLLNVKVVDNAEKVKFLTYTTAMAQGEELCAIARIDPEVGVLPESVSVSGTLDRKPFTQQLKVDNVADKADYLPRTWAKLEIDRLLAENAEQHKKKIVDLSKAMYVMTPYTSLLVLENEAMYQQFKVDRGRKDHWAMYDCPPKIETVYQPDPSQGIDWRVRNSLPTKIAANTNKPAPEQVLQSIMVRMPPRFFAASNPYFGNILAVNALQLMDISYALPEECCHPLPDGDKDLADMPTNMNRLELRGFHGRSGAIRDGFLPNAAMDPLGAPTDGLFGFAGGLNRGPGLMADRLAAVDGLPRQAAARPADFRRRALQIDEAAALRPERGEFLQRFDARQLGQMQSANELFDALKNIEKAKQSAGDGKGEGKGKKVPELSVDAIIARLASGMSRSSMLYHRPGFGGDERIFTDLVAHAPGMNTRNSDILSVLDYEAKPESASAPGKVDDAAAKLIDQARAAGWQQITIPADGRQSSFTIVFNGAGQFRYERVLAEGLREIVVGDDKTLVHLYPELGIGARRDVSRFHRADFADLVPWALPPVEDLARGNDIKAIDTNTIHIVPRDAASAKDADGKSKPYGLTQLAFSNGRLSERRIIEMPANKVIARETYDTDGTVKSYTADNKNVSTKKLNLASAEKPELKPETKNLVVLPLPYRTVQQVFQAFELKDWNFATMKEEAALAMFAANLCQNPWQAQNIYHQAFFNKGNKSIGFYTLLAASNIPVGQNQGWMNVTSVHPNEPLAKYLVRTPGDLGGPKDGFVQRLNAFRDLWTLWNTGKAVEGPDDMRRAEGEKAREYIRQNASSVYGWAILGVMESKVAKDSGSQKALAECYKLFEKSPGLSYAARYELARLELKDGQRGQARKHFESLYESTRKQENGVPAIDTAFKQALQGDENYKQDLFHKLLTDAAQSMIAQNRRGAVITLAWQCRQLDDATLADELFELALGKLSEQEKQTTMLAGVEYLWQTGQQDRAEKMLQELLTDNRAGKNPSLWRLASRLAGQRKLLKRSVEYFDKALEIEYRQMPTVVNLQRVRSDYGQLLSAYQQVAVAMSLLEVPVTSELKDKVIRAADRWRALDSDSTAACHTAARILKYLGHKELAWDYLTTPTAQRPNESAPHLALAQTLRNDGDYDLADKAYVLAFEAESTNAQILWERAQTLQQAGKIADAQKVYRQIAEGEWQPRFQGLKYQARYQLGIR